MFILNSCYEFFASVNVVAHVEIRQKIITANFKLKLPFLREMPRNGGAKGLKWV
jgi:hypothetical protein